MKEEKPILNRYLIVSEKEHKECKEFHKKVYLT